MKPLVVEVSRGEVVEARHTVHAVVLRDGRVELAVGDAGLETYLRSSAKPIQALPVVRARPDLDDEQVALCCASHRATDEQLAVVRRILADAPATEEELECGGEPTPIEHNCSGKHAGFLALCRAEGWPSEGYRRLGHPCQQAILREVASLAEVEPASLPIGVDGCGVPTFALTLERAALAFGRLRECEGGDRVIRAMRAHPRLLLGRVSADARLIEVLPGWIAKGGAEGLFCASSDDGLALALKIEDGAFRPIASAVCHVLGLLGIDAGAVTDGVVRSSHGENVGVVRVV
ncbi:MAG: asparaginase [Actinobacteria bacterium]|nr:asparaginase [Actinomycetota bacterium]